MTDKQPITLPCPQPFVHQVASPDVMGSNRLCVWYTLMFVDITKGAPEPANPEGMQLQPLTEIQSKSKEGEIP